VGSVTGKNNPGAINVAPASVKNRLPGFTYDAAGNPIAGSGSTVTFDAENRLICLGNCATPGVWTYTYDGDGQRVKKSNGTTGTLYWTGMGSDALDESDLSGNINEEYFTSTGREWRGWTGPAT